MAVGILIPFYLSPVPERLNSKSSDDWGLMTIIKLFMIRINSASAPTGPFTSQQLRQMASGGLLLPNAFVAVEGTNQWVVASKVKGLYPVQSADPASDRRQDVSDAPTGQIPIPTPTSTTVSREAVRMPTGNQRSMLPPSAPMSGLMARASSIGFLSKLPISAIYTKVWGIAILAIIGCFIIGVLVGLIPDKQGF